MPFPFPCSPAQDIQAPYHLLKETARLKRLPVVMFAAGGIATPADAALMMQLGCDGVFVGSGIVSPHRVPACLCLCF
jgi:pyridoxal biosynthesis lyase PdxS